MINISLTNLLPARRAGTVLRLGICGSVRPSVRPFSLKLSDLLNVRTTKCTNTVDGCACCASRWRFCCSVCDLCLAVSLSLSVCVCVCVCLCLPVTYGVCAQLRTATVTMAVDRSRGRRLINSDVNYAHDSSAVTTFRCFRGMHVTSLHK